MFDILTNIYDFFVNGIYDLLVEFTTYVLIKLTVATIEFKIFILGFSWDIAQEVLSTFDLSSKIQSGFDSVPSNIRNMLYFFRLPEVITNLLGGFVGRYVFKFLG